MSIVIFFVVYNVQYSAKHVQSVTWKRCWNRTGADSMDTMLVEESGDFMTKEAFVTAQSLEEREKAEDFEITNISKRSGGFSSQKISVRYNVGKSKEKMDLKLKKRVELEGKGRRVCDQEVFHCRSERSEGSG